MTRISKSVCALIMLVAATAAYAGVLDDISRSEANAGVKEALVGGADYAVSSLGRENGFLDNERVRIPLPEALQRIEQALRLFGMGDQADELVAAMNHAAESAVAQARPILMDSIRQMTFSDAKAILTGGDDSVTRYFVRTASGPLTQKFMPIVRNATSRVQVAQQYNRLAGQAANFGLIDEKDADLDAYINQKALDGLFAMIAEQERQLRAHPLEAGSELLKRIFGSL
jgi:hypothetical protein